ncbi:NTF2-like protein [Teratosphaeria nubilosa]|uniref:mRNA export factor MEX67 n=1 Tax=Teratosphaeria nubilosa TaxID=161662 RepID=A0A6G1KVX6_9PEZI|nr:NTF2-like protein [Teratosphaeria nubilosa]
MVARSAPRSAPRGPAATRARRGDKDGDVSMGNISIKGRGGIGKSTAPPTGPKRDLMTRTSKGGILGATAQREILRRAGAGDISMKETRMNAPRGGLAELKVTGWQKSKASQDADGGVASLMKWMEKKASTKLGRGARSVKIKKSHKDGTDLVIKVAPEDAGAFIRLNGWQWAGINVGVERVGGPVQEANAPSSEAEKTKEMLRGVLERRYDPETKLLNLSALGQDEILKSQHIFDKKSTTGKFFPAMMVVLEKSFDSADDLHAAITSVSLAQNDLSDLTAVSSLSMTLPRLLNLDLSNNKFANLAALMTWKKRFYRLKHLILTGNPLEQNEPTYQQTVVNWYPNLRQLNGIQVRSEEDIAKKSKVSNLPFPIRSALFQDENGIAEGFIRNLFAGFDADRAALAQAYYDDKSEFSYAVNTGAPTDPNATTKAEKGEWESYLKESRNLKKISHLPARQNRIFRGTQPISDVFARLPKTKHPDLATEASKWMIEAKMVSGVPDITGASPTGVDGFEINIHSEFDELDSATGQFKKKRSFDRAIILGPGNGMGGVRVVTDLLTVRGYGGVQAFEPDHMEGWTQDATAQAQQVIPDGVPQLPAGVTVELAEQMVAELMKTTGMTLVYAKMCLEQSSWNYEQGVATFNTAKASLPQDAFVQAQ